MIKRIPIIHPGEILLTEFLEPLNISQYRLAKEIDVPPRRINEIIHGKRAITADTALRLSKFFGNSAQQWLNLQNHYELEIENEKRKVFYEEMEKRIENSRIHKSYRTKEVLQHLALPK
jgi:addiction module HigA family antidote